VAVGIVLAGLGASAAVVPAVGVPSAVRAEQAPAGAQRIGPTPSYFECAIQRDRYARSGYTVTECSYHPAGTWYFFATKLQVG
jgi:hypothetical protein